jgi:hypothetical protein
VDRGPPSALDAVTPLRAGRCKGRAPRTPEGPVRGVSRESVYHKRPSLTPLTLPAALRASRFAEDERERELIVGRRWSVEETVAYALGEIASIDTQVQPS